MKAGHAALATALTLWPTAVASATLWVGMSTLEGAVDPPAGYRQAIASLDVQRFNFNDLSPGSDQNGHDLGGFVLVTGLPQASIVAQTGRVAGAWPSSSPTALLVTGPAGAGPVSLSLEVTTPVRIVGFALMGLQCGATMSVYNQNLQFVRDHSVPAGLPAHRRWIGLEEPGCEIGKIVLRPLSSGDYGIDDVEFGRDAPEPGSLLLFAWMPLFVVGGRHLQPGCRVFRRSV